MGNKGSKGLSRKTMANQDEVIEAANMLSRKLVTEQKSSRDAANVLCLAYAMLSLDHGVSKEAAVESSSKAIEEAYDKLQFVPSN